MSDFLTSLASRSLRSEKEVHPQILSVFEISRTSGEIPGGFEAEPDLRDRELNDEVGDGERSGPGDLAARIESLPAIPPSSSAKPSRSDRRAVETHASRLGMEDAEIVGEDSSGEAWGKQASPAAAVSGRQSFPGPLAGQENTPEPSPAAQPSFGDLESTERDRLPAVGMDSTRRIGETGASTAPAPVVAAPIVPAPVKEISTPIRARDTPFSRESEFHRPPEPRVVQISIGRIEIRATTATPPRARVADARERPLSLAEYLQQSAGGHR